MRICGGCATNCARCAPRCKPCRSRSLPRISRNASCGRQNVGCCSDEAAMVDSSFADAAQAPSPAGTTAYCVLRDWRVGVAVVDGTGRLCAGHVVAPADVPHRRGMSRRHRIPRRRRHPPNAVWKLSRRPCVTLRKSVVEGVDFAIQDGASRTSRGTRCDARSNGVVPVRSTTCPVGPCPDRCPRVGLDQSSKRAGTRGVSIPRRSDWVKAGLELAEPAPSMSDAAPQAVPARSDSTDAFGSAGGMGGGGPADYAGVSGGAAGSLGGSASPAMPGAAGMMGRPSGEPGAAVDAGAVLQHDLSLESRTGDRITCYCPADRPARLRSGRDSFSAGQGPAAANGARVFAG